MAEEIRPTGEVNRGFISTSRPGQTLLGKLGDALAVSSSVIDTQVKDAAQRELDETVDLLSSPLITEEEAFEIEQAAAFPISQIKAKNRRGNLIAGQAFESVQDKVAKAPDAPTARKILRDAQAVILDGEEDLSVQAGIRERFAEMAPKMLAESAARRIAKRDRDERVAVAEDQRMALESKDSLEFINTLAGQVFQEQTAGGDVPALLDQSRNSIEAFWLSGDDDTSAGNPNANVAIDRIDDVLDHINLDDAERLKFTRLRERIESAEEAKLIDPNTASLKAKEAAHLQLQNELADWSLANPGRIPPPHMRDAYLRSAPTSAAGRAALGFYKGLTEAAPMGVTATVESEQTRGLLLKRLTNEDGFIEASGPELMAQYDEAVAQLDPNLRGDPTLRRTLQDLADRLVAQQSDVDKAIKERDAEVEARIGERLDRFVQREDFGKLNPDEQREFVERIKENRAPMIRRQRQRELESTARELGVNLQNTVNTSTR